MSQSPSQPADTAQADATAVAPSPLLRIENLHTHFFLDEGTV